MNRKRTGLIIDLFMYLVLLLQLGYVLIGNDLHEILGILFFIALSAHLYLKRYWFSSVSKRKIKLFTARRFADMVIVVLLAVLLVLFISSMGVSRTLFPGFSVLNHPELHHVLAALALSCSVLHGGMHGYFGSKRRKKAVIGIAVCTGISLYAGFGLVPYINRHMRIVEVNYDEMVHGEKMEGDYSSTIAVYFTRVGNTDFTEDADAVSGASLLLADGVRMGNTQVLADMLKDITGCTTAAITLTGEHYPSSYGDTVKVAGIELKNQERPSIEPIDIRGCDTIYLVYPLWWGTIPMPVATFLESNDFTGKKVVLIATQGSSGFSSSTEDIRTRIPEADVIEGVSVYCDDIPKARTILYNYLKTQ